MNADISTRLFCIPIVGRRQHAAPVQTERASLYDYGTELGTLTVPTLLLNAPGTIGTVGVIPVSL